MNDIKMHGDVIRAQRHADDADAESTIQVQVNTETEYRAAEDVARELESEYQLSKPRSILPPGYTIDGEGLFFVFPKGGENHQPETQHHNNRLRLGSALRVLYAVSTKNGGEQARVVQFVEQTRKLEKTVTIPLRFLASDCKQVWSQLADEGYEFSLHPPAKSKLADYIMNAIPIHTRLSVDHTGWVGEADFVLPDRVISSMGTEELLFTGSVFLDGFSHSGTLQGWQERVALPLSSYPSMTFALCCAFAAPILKVLKVPGGGFHFYGPSGTGKTTALRLAAGVVGSESLVGTWRATANGLEAISEAYNDLVLPLDEIYQIDADDLVECIYMIANGKGKHRSNRQGNGRPAKAWNVLILSCGESPIGDICRKLPEGARNRLVDIEFDDRPAPSLCRDLSLAMKEEHGTALPVFLQRCMMNLGLISDAWKQYRQQFQMNGATGSSDRVVTRVATISFAGKLAFQFGILPYDPTGVLDIVSGRILSSYQGGNSSRNVIDAVRSFILDNSAKIWSPHNRYPKEPLIGVAITDDEGNPESPESPPGTVVEYVLFPQQLKSYLSSLGLSSKEVVSKLHEEGLLGECDPGRGRQRRVMHPTLGNRTGGYPIKSEIINE
jgi:hypothetical protein